MVDVPAMASIKVMCTLHTMQLYSQHKAQNLVCCFFLLISKLSTYYQLSKIAKVGDKIMPFNAGSAVCRAFSFAFYCSEKASSTFWFFPSFKGRMMDLVTRRNFLEAFSVLMV